MTKNTNSGRYMPMIILSLVAALVTVLALWATDRARINTGGDKIANVPTSAAENTKVHWKIITTWPKNFPGLGAAAENFATMVDEMCTGLRGV